MPPRASTPRRARGAEARAGGRLRVRRWVPQAALLRHAKVRAFVSHAGGGAVAQAAAAGVPVVAAPVFADQHHRAARLAARHLHREVAEELSSTSCRVPETSLQVPAAAGAVVVDPSRADAAEVAARLSAGGSASCCAVQLAA